MADHRKSDNTPPIGLALWLLGGGRVPDRLNWLVANEFRGLALLQSAMDIDPVERSESAAIIKAEELTVTYHGNVHHKLTESGDLDSDFSDRMIDDVIWWHEHTNGVASCCSDPINIPSNGEAPVFDSDLNRRHLERLAGRLGAYGIRVGIENSFGGRGRFCSPDDISSFKAFCAETEFGLLLDAGHANIHVRSDAPHSGDISTYVDDLPLDILEVHLCDNFGERDEHKQIGYGNLDIDGLFRSLRGKDFDGMLTLEVCLDILSGKYSLNISDTSQTDALLISRDAVRSAWLL